MPRESLGEVFRLRSRWGRVPFQHVVESSSTFKVIPINLSDSEDTELLNYITNALNSFVRLTERSGQRFKGNRINDVGKKFEYMIVEELKKTPLDVEKLGRSGYPDFKIVQDERTSYLEIKTTGNLRQAQTHHRMFYYSSGNKITEDARHLLVQIQMEEEQSKYWKVISWELRDLAKLKVRLKTEFNAGFQDFVKTPLLGSSSVRKSLRRA
jgi:hypothetical protein